MGSWALQLHYMFRSICQHFDSSRISVSRAQSLDVQRSCRVELRLSNLGARAPVALLRASVKCAAPTSVVVTMKKMSKRSMTQSSKDCKYPEKDEILAGELQGAQFGACRCPLPGTSPMHSRRNMAAVPSHKP